MPKTECDISVIIATKDRSQMLEQTLNSLQRQRIKGLSWEVVVVDNGSADDTQSVLRRPWPGLSLVILFEPIAGKSRALNQALEVAQGGLLVFTDDDALFSVIWLEALHEASIRHKSGKVFCGPVTPRLPKEAPAWLSSNPYVKKMFAWFDPEITEGPLPKPLLPFGVNNAIKRSAVKQEKFRLDLGPSAENGPMFNEDIEFVRRFSEPPGSIIFVPQARVLHQVPASRISMESLCERSFYYGRAQILDKGQPFFIHKEVESNRPRTGSSEVLRYSRDLLANYYLGQQYQLLQQGITGFGDDLQHALREIDIDS